MGIEWDWECRRDEPPDEYTVVEKNLIAEATSMIQDCMNGQCYSPDAAAEEIFRRYKAALK